MATYRYKKLTDFPIGWQPNPGDRFVWCNFSQNTPNTEIFGDIDLTFRYCNLARVDIKPNWKVNRSNNTSQNPLPVTLTARQKARRKLRKAWRIANNLEGDFPGIMGQVIRCDTAKDTLEDDLTTPDPDHPIDITVTNGGDWEI